MPTAQNGWPVIPDTDAGRDKLADLILPGKMPHKVRVLEGDVHTIATWHVAEYHKRVEPIKPAGCWGWNVRKIGNGTDWSNHAAACAWDINAPDNPDGVPTKKVMTAKQIDECHELEREAKGVLRWGGDWGDPDAMHWEIVGSRAQCAAFAKTLKPVEVRKLEWQEFKVTMPVLKEGDNDDMFPGYDRIKRIQRQVGTKVDGWWGEKTSAALGYKVMNIERWRNLFGLGDPA